MAAYRVSYRSIPEGTQWDTRYASERAWSAHNADAGLDAMGRASERARVGRGQWLWTRRAREAGYRVSYRSIPEGAHGNTRYASERAWSAHDADAGLCAENRACAFELGEGVAEAIVVDPQGVSQLGAR